jgi:hypothetical protein
MKTFRFRKLLGLILISVFFVGIFKSYSFAEILSRWDDPEGRAYRPYPVLFLHGFAKGDYTTWQAKLILRIIHRDLSL